MALTTIQVAFLFLQFFPPVVNSDYYPDVGYHLDRWNKQMVRLAAICLSRQLIVSTIGGSLVSARGVLFACACVL
jgi:anthranilate/para-aminobenzoate synthase component II